MIYLKKRFSKIFSNMNSKTIINENYKNDLNYSSFIRKKSNKSIDNSTLHDKRVSFNKHSDLILFEPESRTADKTTIKRAITHTQLESPPPRRYRLEWGTETLNIFL